MNFFVETFTVIYSIWHPPSITRSLNKINFQCDSSWGCSLKLQVRSGRSCLFLLVPSLFTYLHLHFQKFHVVFLENFSDALSVHGTGSGKQAWGLKLWMTEETVKLYYRKSFFLFFIGLSGWYRHVLGAILRTSPTLTYKVNEEATVGAEKVGG